MSLHSKIHAAQVLAAEDVVVRDLHDRGLCNKDTCKFCLEAHMEELSESAARAAATPEQLLEHFVDWLLEQENINLPRAEQLKQLAREFLHEFLA